MTWLISSLAYQIRNSVIFTWDRDSYLILCYLTHIILLSHSANKIHARNWSFPLKPKFQHLVISIKMFVSLYLNYLAKSDYQSARLKSSKQSNFETFTRPELKQK